MKASVLSLFILFNLLSLQAQQVPKLFGLHSTSTNTVFSSLTISGGNYSALSTQTAPYVPVINKTSFDRVGARYFIKSGSTVYIFNALSGILVDSIPNQSNFHNMEYDAISDKLVGVEKYGSNFVFKIVDPITKLSQIKGNLDFVDSLIIGESCFDTPNRRYFTLTNRGLISVNPDGKIIDVLCASPALNGVEYEQVTNKVYYLEWNGSAFDFVGVEATTCSIGLVGTFPGMVTAARGESTFNSALRHYFCRTNFGIQEIDTQTGLVVQTLTPSANFAHMEYADLSTVGIDETSSIHSERVYPNPSAGIFNFDQLQTGSLLEIFNSDGQSISSTHVQTSHCSLSLSEHVKGLYLYRITAPNSPPSYGKLLLR